MATVEEIGGVKVSIVGDYSTLPAAFDAASALARNFAGRFTQIIGTASPALDSLGSQFIKTGTAMSIGLTAPIVALGAAMASGSEDFRKFELSMRQVTSLMGTVSQNEFKKLSDATLELSTRLGVDAVNAAKGLYEAISAGVPKENAITFLEVASKTAIAGITSTKVAVDGLTTVLNAFHLETGKTKEVADAMFMAVNLGKFTFEQLAASMSKAMPLAAQVGVSFKEVLAAAATLTKQGVPVSEAMTQISRAITSIVAPSKEMQAVFAKIGVESGKVLLETRGLEGALQAIRDATGGVEDDMFKAMRRMEGFRALLGLTGENARVAAEDLAAVTNSTGAMDLAFKEIEKSGARGFESLKVAMKNLSIQAAEVLAPAIAQIVKNMQPLIEWLMDAVKWFAKLDPAIQQTTGYILVIAASAGPLALMVGWFLKLREAAILLAPKIMSVTGALNLLAKVPYVALIASLVALAKATYDWKQAQDSMNQSAKEQESSLKRLESSLINAGVSISDLSSNYHFGLISQTEYLRGLQALAKEHGDALPKVKAFKLELDTIPPPLREGGAAAKQSAADVQELADSYASAQVRGIEAYHAALKMAEATRELSMSIRDIPPEFPTTLADIAEKAREAGITLEVMVPPELPQQIEEVAKKTETWGNVTESAATRSKESIREIRRAVESISDSLAKSIIHWKGWGEGAKNVLEAVGEAILKTVIKRILDATGLVDKLMDGITAVLSKIGINAATSAATSASSAGGALAASASSGGGSSAGSLLGSIGKLFGFGGGGNSSGGSLASEAGLANSGGVFSAGGGSSSSGGSGLLGSLFPNPVDLAMKAIQGIVQGIQTARMEADVAKIEISTRQTKEQLVGGVQPTLNQYLPNLVHLVDIWSTLLTANQILRDISARVGGVGNNAETAEILKYLSLLTTPYTSPDTLQPIGGATVSPDLGSMAMDSARGGKLSRGFNVLAGAVPRTLAEGEYISDPTRQFPTVQSTGIDPAGNRVISMADWETWRKAVRAMGVLAEYVDPNTGRMTNSTNGLYGRNRDDSGDAQALVDRLKQLLSPTAELGGVFANAQGIIAELRANGQTDEDIYRVLSRFPSGQDFSGTRIGIPSQPAYSGGGRAATDLSQFTEAYQAMQNSGGGAFDLGNSSFINIGGAASGGSTRAGMTAAQTSAVVEQYLRQLQQEIASRGRQAEIAEAQLNTWKDAEEYVRRLLAAGNSMDTIRQLFQVKQANLTGQLDRGEISYEDFGKASNALLPGFAMSGTNTKFGGFRSYAAPPLDTEGIPAGLYQLLHGQFTTAPIVGSGVPMGANGGSVPITIYATDSSARSIGNGLITVLQQNGIYR